MQIVQFLEMAGLLEAALPGGFVRIMIIALVAFAATMGIARADTDRFQNIRREPRSDAQLDADSAYCQSKTGENSNGKRTSLPFKRCMLTRGWKYLRTAREGDAPIRRSG